jgi:hypothetical protein
MLENGSGCTTFFMPHDCASDLNHDREDYLHLRVWHLNFDDQPTYHKKETEEKKKIDIIERTRVYGDKDPRKYLT